MFVVIMVLALSAIAQGVVHGQPVAFVVGPIAFLAGLGGFLARDTMNDDEAVTIDA